MKRAEDSLQRALAAYLDLALPHDACWFAVPNGGARSKKEAAILAGLGVKPGAPDILVFWGGRAFAIELKAPRGRVSPAQEAMHQALRRAEVAVIVASSLGEVERWLAAWGVPLKGRIAA
jgi:hypothetical protein